MTSWLRLSRDDGTEACCCPECRSEVDESRTWCTVCGYDIVTRARVDLAHPPQPS